MEKWADVLLHALERVIRGLKYACRTRGQLRKAGGEGLGGKGGGSHFAKQIANCIREGRASSFTTKGTRISPWSDKPSQGENKKTGDRRKKRGETVRETDSSTFRGGVVSTTLRNGINRQWEFATCERRAWEKKRCEKRGGGKGGNVVKLVGKRIPSQVMTFSTQSRRRGAVKDTEPGEVGGRVPGAPRESQNAQEKYCIGGVCYQPNGGRNRRGKNQGKMGGRGKTYGKEKEDGAQRTKTGFSDGDDVIVKQVDYCRRGAVGGGGGASKGEASRERNRCQINMPKCGTPWLKEMGWNTSGHLTKNQRRSG